MTPLKTSKIFNPLTIQNKQNILNSIEDKKFFEDLENIQSTHKEIISRQNQIKAKKATATKKKKKVPTVLTSDERVNLSQKGNSA